MKKDKKMILMGKLIDGKGGFAEKAIIEIQRDRIIRVEFGAETKAELNTWMWRT